MVSKVLWAAETGVELMTTELNSLADDNVALDSTDFDNATNKYTEASFLLYLGTPGGVPDGGGIELHAFYAVDGTNYGDTEDGDLANVETGDYGNASTLLGVFPVREAADIQYIQMMGVALKPFSVRFALKNTTGQTLAATGNTLDIYPHNFEGQ